jgi:hypothetical protein
MLRIKNKRANIPNGYLYVQRETGFDVSKVMPHTINDFYAVAQAIRQHRAANPQFKLSTSMPAIEEELERVNAARIAAIPGAAAVYLMEVGGAPTSFQVPPTLSSQVVAAVKAVSAGAENIADWLDSETPPVISEVSKRRAETCVKCPKNELGSLDRFFTAPAVALITLRLEKLHARKLSTPYDSQLGTCAACMCRNQLKVHEPIELVVKHTSDEVWAKLDKSCWVISETNEIDKEAA